MSGVCRERLELAASGLSECNRVNTDVGMECDQVEWPEAPEMDKEIVFSFCADRGRSEVDSGIMVTNKRRLGWNVMKKNGRGHLRLNNIMIACRERPCGS